MMILIPKLTPRQLQVISLIADGHGDKQVAKLLGVSPNTAKVHRMHIYKRLGFHSTVDLVHWALAYKLVRNKYEDVVSGREALK